MRSGLHRSSKPRPMPHGTYVGYSAVVDPARDREGERYHGSQSKGLPEPWRSVKPLLSGSAVTRRLDGPERYIRTQVIRVPIIWVAHELRQAGTP